MATSESGIRPGDQPLSLQEQAALLSTIFTRSLEGMVFIDPTFIIRAANTAFADQTRLALHEIVGRRVDEVMPGWTDQIAHLYRQVQESGTPFKSQALPVDHPDQPERGTTYWDSSLSPVYGADDVFLGGLLLLSEATERVRRESERESLVEELREVNQQLAVTGLEAQEQSDFINAVLDTAGSLVLVLTPGGRIVRFNRACEQLTGYSFAEVEGLRFQELFLLPEDLQPVEAVVDELRAGSFPNQYENYWRTRDGHLRMIAWTNTALLGKDGAVEHIIATGLDVTERRQAEQALRQSEEWYRRIIETANEGVWVVDRDSVITFVNGKLAQMLGYSIEEMVGRRATEFFEAPWRAVAEEESERRHRGLAGQHETRITCKDGSELWAIISSAPVLDGEGRYAGTLGMTTDITARRRAEEELRRAHDELEVRVAERTAELARANQVLQTEVAERRKAEEALLQQFRQFSTIFDSMKTLVYVADMHTHELLFLNAYGVELFGAGAIGRPCFHVLQSGQTGPCAFCTNDRLVCDGVPQPPYVWEFQNTVTERWFQCVDQAIPWSDGHLVRMEIAMDISERKEMERQLAVTNERLRVQNEELQAQSEEIQSQREELQTQNEELLAHQQEREDFIRMISHDLRNPLTGIYGRAQMLEEMLTGGKRPDLQRRSVEAILAASRHMQAMIQDLAESARLESGTLEMRKRPLDLCTFVSEVAERIGTSEDRGRLRVEIGERLPSMLADPDRLERALVNLIANGLKYSPPEAPVVVRVRWLAGEAAISVVDQGIGISPDDLPRVFERGFRAKEARSTREGLGLGLYIARLIVEAHGGRVWAESELGRGSSFHLAVPLPGTEP